MLCSRKVAVSYNCNALTAKCRDAVHSWLYGIAMLRNRGIVTPYHRTTLSIGPRMKKNRDSSELAARIAAAASQPAGRSSAPSPVATSTSTPVLVSSTPAAKAPAVTPVVAPARPKAKKTKPAEPDTVPITLRPSSALLSKFVIKASERTREEGRVVSAQQIMIEALERSVL